MAPRAITAEQFQKFLKNAEDYDRVLDKVKIISAEDGRCLAELKIEKEHTNRLQILHGGLSSTLVDVITSFGLLTHEKCLEVYSVSVDLHVTYIKSAVAGDEIIIDARTLRVGKTLAYLECEIRNKSTGELLVKGTQTKYLMQPKN